MSSNLIKSYSIGGVNDNTRIIDTNKMMEQKMDALREILGDAFATASQESVSDEMVEGLDVRQVAALLDDDGGTVLHEHKEPEVDVEAMLAAAKEEADAIIEAARQEAESIRVETFEAAKEEGYHAGYEEGMERVRSMEKAVKDREAEIMRMERIKQQEYEQMCKELEPLLVDKLLSIYKHVLHIEAGCDRAHVLYLIENAMMNVEGGKNLIVHISKDDYPYVTMQKARLLECVGQSTSVEFIEDFSLGKSECYIDAEGTIIDCGFDTQLEQLEKELRILSYEGN